jgi:superfamily II DNA/RNA helicase
MTTDFNGFGLAPKLMQALVRMNFTAPTPIQSAAIPLALAGNDILGSAQTGTGKTGAYGIPLIAKLMDNAQASAIILTPTRELATQVMAALQQMIPVPTIRTALLIGGEAMPKQFRQLQNHPRLIVGTPGRINDHLARGSLRLDNTRFVVLDETDRMLDMGFGVQIDKIVAVIPKERQTMMFSATLPPAIVKMSTKYMRDAKRISVGSVTAAAPNIRQELVSVVETEKYQALLTQLKDQHCTTIIFVKTKYGTEKLADKLMRINIRAQAMHGDLKQSRRDRVLQDYRDKRFQVLVATDLAARGLDVPHIELVINYDMPQCPEDYIHRIGRTARAGASGKAVNLLTPSDGDKWRAIRRLMNPEEAGNEPRDKPKGKKRGGGRRFGSYGAGGGGRSDSGRSEGGRSESGGARAEGARSGGGGGGGRTGSGANRNHKRGEKREGGGSGSSSGTSSAAQGFARRQASRKA